MPVSFKNHTLLLLAICMSFCCASKPKIKSCKSIHYNYRIYCGEDKTTIDSNIIYYDTAGIQTNSDNQSGVIVGILLKEETLDSTFEKVVKKLYWSHGGIETEIQNNYKDSEIIICINEKGDTSSKRSIFFHRGKIVKDISKFLDYLGAEKTYRIYEEDKISNNFFKKKYVRIESWSSGYKRETFFVYYKLLRIHKEYSYNDSTKKWFRSLKEKYNRNQLCKKRVTRMYNYYGKQYFLEFTKYKYNSYGDVILVIIQNDSRGLDSKIIYSYEYY